MSYHVYALYSSSLQLLYVGQSKEIQKRLNDHKRGYSKFTSRSDDWELIYVEELKTRSAAMKRERQLKSYQGREYLKTFIHSSAK